MSTSVAPDYVPHGRNTLHTILENHFTDFIEYYDEKYAATYGRYRLERIQQICDRFSLCGDYLQGVARIRCTNPECGHDYFRPFSCKGFYLCPSCSRKRTILFAEHLVNDVLLRLPHRQFVFTIPKMLRPFFRHNRRLFAEVSRLIYDILCEFYSSAAGRPLLTGIVVAHQTFGDMLRWNPHFHAIVLEGYFKQNIHIHASCYVAIDESHVHVKQKADFTRIGMYGHGSLCFDLGGETLHFSRPQQPTNGLRAAFL